MPYKRHDHLSDPEDTNAYVWRYMSLPKFLDMLSTASLYFCLADRFDDPYEGLMSDRFAESMKNGASTLGFEQTHVMLTRHRTDFYLNSWHLSDAEDAGMWRLYAGVDGGIAVRSTYSRLKQALNASKERGYLGTLPYDDSVLHGQPPQTLMPYTNGIWRHVRNTCVYPGF